MVFVISEELADEEKFLAFSLSLLCWLISHGHLRGISEGLIVLASGPLLHTSRLGSAVNKH